MLEIRKAAGALDAFVSRVSLADVAPDSTLFDGLHRVTITGYRPR